MKNQGRVLYHMVRADFLERVRRYNFLLTLGFAVYLGYAVYRGQIAVQLDTYRGVMNSAWIGSVVSLVATLFLTLIGFYVVKNSIQRDRETRVGRILASTPMTRSFYTLAKALSNFAVLAAMIVVLALAALLILWLHGQHGRPDYFALLAPVFIFGLCGVSVTAAMAVLFETIPGLRGGMGNIVYFFVWVAMLSLGVGQIDSHAQGTSNGPAPLRYLGDYSGVASTMGQMRAQVHQLDALYQGGSSFQVGGIRPATKTFVWTGLIWSPAIVLSRVLWVGIAAALALLAAVFFDRFDPARERSFSKAGKAEKGGLRRLEPAAASGSGAGISLSSASVSVPARSVRELSVANLAPLARTRARGRFSSLVYAEFLLMARGRGWWWYAIAAGLFVACLASPLSASRPGIILAAWIWPALLWSQLGTREAQFSTQSLIFSAPKAFPRQLLASYAAGVLVSIITGGGLGFRLVLARDFAGLEAWTAAALFIPGLALALGVCTGSRKPFEALYTAWWYVGPLHQIPGADFIGTTAQSSRPGAYLLSAALLLAAALAWRKLRLAHR